MIYSINTFQFIQQITIQTKNNKNQAASLKISSVSNSSPLSTSFVLTTEDLITNKIDDYQEVLSSCTPDKSLTEFILTDKQMQEIKRLIKNLHKAIPDNTAYLTFTVNSEKKNITVNDKVFNIDFQNIFETKENTFSFNILKSDFLMTGNHSFSIYSSSADQRVIFGGRYSNSIIWGLSTKITESVMNFDSSVMEATIDSLNIEEYLD